MGGNADETVAVLCAELATLKAELAAMQRKLLALAGAEKHLERVPGHVSQNEGDGWRWKDERLEAELAALISIERKIHLDTNLEI